MTYKNTELLQMCIHNLVNRMGDIYNMKFKYSCKSKIDYS